MAMTIAKRLGTFAWWMGALNLVVAILVAITMVMKTEGRNYWVFFLVIGSLTPVCWLLSYVLAGSFWKPPHE